MRNILKFIILAMLTTSLTSCEKIKSWFNVEIDTNLEGQLNLVSDDTELKSAEAFAIDGFAEIDLSDNEDLEEYADLIEDIVTNSVSLQVLLVDASDVVIHAGSEFSITTPTNPGLRWPIGADFPVQVGSTIDLTAEDYSVLNEMLEGGEIVTIMATGSCNVGGVHITLNYDIDVTVEANPL